MDFPSFAQLIPQAITPPPKVSGRKRAARARREEVLAATRPYLSHEWQTTSALAKKLGIGLSAMYKRLSLLLELGEVERIGRGCGVPPGVMWRLRPTHTKRAENRS